MTTSASEMKKRLSDLKNGIGFRLGNGKVSQAEVTRRRKEIKTAILRQRLDDAKAA